MTERTGSSQDSEGTLDDQDRLYDPLRTAVIMAVGLLVDGQYETLEAMTRARYLSAEQLKENVDEYRKKLTAPPDGAYDHLDIVQVPGEEMVTFDVKFPLWTETGVTDLALQLRLIERYKHAFATEITGLGVA